MTALSGWEINKNEKIDVGEKYTYDLYVCVKWKNG